jgi:hypothetical protein
MVIVSFSMAYIAKGNNNASLKFSGENGRLVRDGALSLPSDEISDIDESGNKSTGGPLCHFVLDCWSLF